MLPSPIGYELTRNWFAYVQAHPDVISPNHTALYTWLVEENKANEWQVSFGCRSADAMQGMGVKRYETFKKTFDDLITLGFVEVMVAGNNQHCERKIGILKNSKAPHRGVGVQLQLALRAGQRQVKTNTKALRHYHDNPVSIQLKAITCD